MPYDYSDETKQLRDNGYSQDLIDFICKTDTAWIAIVDELFDMRNSFPPGLAKVRKELDLLRDELWAQVYDNRAPGAPAPDNKQPPEEIVVNGHTYHLAKHD